MYIVGFGCGNCSVLKMDVIGEVSRMRLMYSVIVVFRNRMSCKSVFIIVFSCGWLFVFWLLVDLVGVFVYFGGSIVCFLFCLC